jgi:hypothetical protein
MDKHYFETMVDSIREVLMHDPAMSMSWGVEEFRPVEFNGMPALEFTVDGFLHKGKVIVAYNGGADLYEVFRIGSENVIAGYREGVYFDELTGVIDRMVEKDCTDEQYGRMIDAWLDSLPKDDTADRKVAV